MHVPNSRADRCWEREDLQGGSSSTGTGDEPRLWGCSSGAATGDGGSVAAERTCMSNNALLVCSAETPPLAAKEGRVDRSDNTDMERMAAGRERWQWRASESASARCR